MRVLHDQFYTRPDVAALCVARLQSYAPSGAWIEPSAGTGSFLTHVPDAIAYDIDPKDPRIQRADFLTVELPPDCVVFGNPPFGRQSSLAKRFIRHACASARWIGFILPRSFVKPSMQTAFPPCFHCRESMDLPKDSFLANGAPYDVPCVFQVWERCDVPREVEAPPVLVGARFVKQTDPHHLAFRRVGGTAGRCALPSPSQNPRCYYFLALEDPSCAARLIDASQTYAFPSNTTGPRSLSKAEAIRFLLLELTPRG
jgi:hypothetical protein